MQKYPYVDADYCQYSDWGYQKPTRFWGSEDLQYLNLKCCDGRTCPNLVGEVNRVGKRKHRIRVSGSHTNISTNKKYRIPEALVRELAGGGSTACHVDPCMQRPPSSYTIGKMWNNGKGRQLS